MEKDSSSYKQCGHGQSDVFDLPQLCVPVAQERDGFGGVRSAADGGCGSADVTSGSAGAAVLKYGFFEPMLFIMVFLLAYFVLSTLIATILLKDPLIRMKKATEELQGVQEETED